MTAEPAGEIVHVATPSEWAAARRTGQIAPPSLATEGFVHCSTRAQLAGTLERHFAGAGPLVLLLLDEGAIAPDLRWEEGRPGERFPHVYAAIPVTAVVAVEEIR
jgi:uncharacterized protein (DUF952 family)